MLADLKGFTFVFPQRHKRGDHPEHRRTELNQATPSATHMVNAVTRLIGGAERMNFLVHISEETGFVYFGNPTASHIRILASMNIAIAAAYGEELKYTNFGQLFRREFGRMTSPLKEGPAIFADMLDDPDTFKFTFVRNPVSRYLNTYYSMLSTNTPNTPHRQKVFRYLGLDLSQDLPLADLAALLAQDTGLRAIIPNLDLQRNLTAFDLVDYGFIGQHENWDRDFAVITNQIFGHPVTPFDTMAAFGQGDDHPKANIEIEAPVLANLENAYTDDFEMIAEINAMGPPD